MNKKKTKKKKRVNKGKVMLILTFALILVITLGATFTSDIFNSKKIDISGNKELKRDYIVDKLNISKNKNIFEYNTKKMEKLLLQNTYVDSVNIKRSLPDKLIININEKEEVALLNYNKDYCYIDKEGYLLKKVAKIEEGKDVIVVDIEYSIDEQNIVKFKDEDSKKRLLYLLSKLDEQKIYNRIDTINFKNKGTISMKTINSIKILLPNDDNIDYNIAMASEVLIDLQNKNKNNGTIDMVNNKNVVYSP